MTSEQKIKYYQEQTDQYTKLIEIEKLKLK